MRTNREQVHRLRRMIQAGNEMVEAEKLRNPQKAKQMDAMLQASINGLLRGGERVYRIRPWETF